MKLPSILAASLTAALLASASSAQNLLTNGDFELGGLAGWGAFGNAYPASANPPAVDPLSGTEICTMFGNFSGGFDVSGIFQSFPAVEGDSFTLDAGSRHWDGDALFGGGAPDDNWVVMKIAFFDGGGAEIGGAEGTILDGTSPTNTWIDNAEVNGTAPAGTVEVQALILFLQPNNDGGAAQIDDVVFTSSNPPPPSDNLLVNGDFEDGGLVGWGAFGNAYPASANPPSVEPLSGTEICTMFGNFSGGFDVSGIFQSFPAVEGDSFTLDAWSRHWDGDALFGGGAPDDNWVVMKIAFFDGGGVEIGAAEGTILDGTSPTNTWIDNAEVNGTAPAGTVEVQALILFLQPNNDGGAAQIDDVVFTSSTPPPPPSLGPNLLGNADFEDGLYQWSTFGNAYPADSSAPGVDPLSGTGVCTMFGNFSGGFDVTGIFQTFPATPGQEFTLDAWSRHWDGDPLVGIGPPSDNWVVMKIAFFDGGGAEIGAAEGIILDGTSPTNTWIDNTPVSGTAPAGTESVQALILFLQPFDVGGAAQIDDVVFSSMAPCELSVNGDFETGDFTGWQEFPSAPGSITIGSPGKDSSFAGCINNTVLASASLIKNANIGAGEVVADETITITLDAKGSTAVGGVVFAELFSELDGGGVSKSEILGGAPLALDPDPDTWTTFSFTTTLGPDVSGGVTLQLAAITGGAEGSLSNVCFDNISVTVERLAASWTNYGTGWDGTNGIPTLELESVPALGQVVNVLLGNASGTDAPSCLFFGGEQISIPTVVGGTQLTNLVQIYPLTVAPGGDSIALQVPSKATLCGAEAYGQMVQFDTGASASFSFSPGLRIIFGGQ